MIISGSSFVRLNEKCSLPDKQVFIILLVYLKGSISFRRAFPMFILYFVIAAIITTVCIHFGVPAAAFAPLKELSKFMIIMAMAAIGLNSNVIKLIKSGGKPIVLGACCWVGITVVSLLMQHVMQIW
jgi:uncharacterized membrane protein YadS